MSVWLSEGQETLVLFLRRGSEILWMRSHSVNL